MQNKILFVLLIAGVFVLPSCFGHGEMKIPATKLGVVIAHEGKTETAIVVPASAGEATLLLANDIQTYIKRISGVDVAIVTPEELREEHRCAIALGIPEIQEALEKAVGKLGPEEYALKSCSYKERQSIAVVGGSELALQYGGYAMVELFMGVKFFHPEHEFLPEKKSLFIGRRIYWREKPRFALRGMEPRLAGGMSEFGRVFTDADNLKFAENYIDYLVKNRQNLLAMNPQITQEYSPHFKKMFAYAHMRGLKVMLRSHENAGSISADSLKALCELGADFVEVAAPGTQDEAKKITEAQKILREYGAKLFVRNPGKPAAIPADTGISVTSEMCRDLVLPPTASDGGLRTQYDAIRRLAGDYETVYSPATSCMDGRGLDVPLPNPVFIQLRYDDTVRLTLCGAAGQIHKTCGLEWLSWLNDFAAMRYNWDPERWNARAVLREFASIFGPKAQPDIEQGLLRTIVALERLHATDCLEGFLSFRRKVKKPAVMENEEFGRQQVRTASPLESAINPVSEELDAALRQIAGCAGEVEPGAREWYDEVNDCATLLSLYARYGALALAAKSAESDKLMRSLDEQSQGVIDRRRSQYRYPQQQH